MFLSTVPTRIIVNFPIWFDSRRFLACWNMFPRISRRLCGIPLFKFRLRLLFDKDIIIAHWLFILLAVETYHSTRNGHNVRVYTLPFLILVESFIWRLIRLNVIVCIFLGSILLSEIRHVLHLLYVSVHNMALLLDLLVATQIIVFDMILRLISIASSIWNKWYLVGLIDSFWLLGLLLSALGPSMHLVVLYIIIHFQFSQIVLRRKVDWHIIIAWLLLFYNQLLFCWVLLNMWICRTLPRLLQRLIAPILLIRVLLVQ